MRVYECRRALDDTAVVTTLLPADRPVEPGEESLFSIRAETFGEAIAIQESILYGEDANPFESEQYWETQALWRELNERRGLIAEIRSLGHADVNALIDKVLGPHGA